MAVVAMSAVERFRGISATEAAKSGVLGSSCKLQYQSSVNFQVNVCEAAEETGYVSLIWLSSVQRSNHTMAFKNIIKVVHESLLGEGKERSGGSNCEITDFLSGFFADDDASSTKRILFANIWAMLLNAGRGIGFGSNISSNESVSKFGCVGNPLEITDEEIDGDQDDRQKRKQTDSKHGGDKGKNSRSDGGSTSSSACGTGDGGSSGDDGGDDGEEGGRRESGGGPQSATDEAMEEDEEKEDSVEMEKGENLDITGVPGFAMPGTVSGTGSGTGTGTGTGHEQDNRRAEEERAQARRTEAAEAAFAAAGAAAAARAAAAAAAGAAAARRAEEEGGGDEARAGQPRPVSRTDEEDPEEVGQMSESPETPSEGSPSQTPTPPPDVTEAIDATDV